MLYCFDTMQKTNVNGVVSVLTVTGTARSLTGIHIKNVKLDDEADANNEGYNEGYNKGIRSRGGGAGASTVSAGALPETIDKAKAKELEGSASLLASATSQLEGSNAERERLAIETAEQKEKLEQKEEELGMIKGQLGEAQSQLTSASATLSSKVEEVEGLSRQKHELEVEYRSYQEHHSSSNEAQMTAISELKVHVERLSDQVTSLDST